MRPIRVRTLTLATLFVFAACLVVALSQCGLSESAKDARLDQKVSLKVSGQTLREFLAEVSRQTGVNLSAKGEAADFRLIVMAKDIALGDLLQSVGDVLHIELYREGSEDRWEYIFQQDAKNAREADLLKRKTDEQLPRQMSMAVEALKLPEEEIQKKIKEDLVVAPFINQKEFRMAVKLYGWLDDARRARLWTNGVLPVRLSELSDDVRKLVAGEFADNLRYREKSEKVKFTDRLVGVCFEAQDDPLGGRSLWLTLSGSKNNNMSLVLNPSPEDGINIVQNESLFEIKTEPDEILGEVYKVVPRKPLEGRLAEKAKTEFPKSVVLPQALAQMCDAEDVSFVCDFFVPRYLTAVGPREWVYVGGDSFAELVERIAGLFFCRWKMNGRTCLLSGKEWYCDRESNIPQGRIAHWQGLLQTGGGFGLREFADMASLNDKQLKGLRYMGVPYPASFLDVVKPLRFVYALDDERMKLALSSDGLRADSLTRAQKDKLVAWLEAMTPPNHETSKFSAADAEGAVVRVKQEGNDGYVFSIETRGGRTRSDVLKLK